MEDKSLLSDVKKLIETLGPLPEPEAKPVFIAVSGLPGTGKSFFSRKLAGRLPLVILESDALRKVLFPVPGYSQQESARLFRACYFLIEMLLGKGISLVLDATNLVEKYRERLYHIADRLNAKLVLVRVEAPLQLVKERLQARTGDPETRSDADWEVYQKMRPSVDRIERKHFVVDTSRDIIPVIDKIAREVNRKGA